MNGPFSSNKKKGLEIFFFRYRGMRVSRGGMRLKARAQAFGHPHYQLVTSKVEIFQDDLLTSLQLTI